MNEFLNFARAHGLIVEYVKVGKWVRVPTLDHPKKRNGAYKFMGDVGFVQNHATQTDVSVWKPEGNKPIFIDHAAIKRQAEKAEREREIARAEAAKKAEWILSQCAHQAHPYLATKGFETEHTLVWKTDSGSLMVVPMRVNGKLTSLQLIDKDGNKKFLTGGATAGAVFQIGSGPAILCEGYATGLSLRDAVIAAKTRRSVIVCFSAGNMKRVAAQYPNAVVIADNDESKTGETTAKAIGFPYWVSDKVGEDFNDFSRRASLFQRSQVIKTLIIKGMQ
jgi:putative DNA primase/helicase